MGGRMAGLEIEALNRALSHFECWEECGGAKGTSHA